MSSSSSTAFAARQVVSGAPSPVRPLYWSVRRELWESRSLYFAPLSAAVVFFLGFLISAIHLPTTMRGLSSLDAMRQHETIALPYNMAAGLLMLIAMVVGALYCVDTLQGERRDRSILFWKSLPVSDRTTVLAKAIVPIFLLQLFTFAVTFALQSAMLLVSSAILSANGVDVATLWTELSFPRMSLLLLYHLVSVHALSHAPFYGWFLFVSAWARRAALLWALLLPVALGTLERIAFGTSHFADMVMNRLGAGATDALAPSGTLPMDAMSHPTPLTFLVSPGLWAGMALTAVFLAAAIRLRHYRGPTS